MLAMCDFKGAKEELQSYKVLTVDVSEGDGQLHGGVEILVEVGKEWGDPWEGGGSGQYSGEGVGCGL